MADGTKLELTFQNSEGKDIIFLFNYAKPSASRANVKALVDALIANGDIFENVPATAKSAKKVTTSETVYDIS